MATNSKKLFLLVTVSFSSALPFQNLKPLSEGGHGPVVHKHRGHHNSPNSKPKLSHVSDSPFWYGHAAAETVSAASANAAEHRPVHVHGGPDKFKYVGVPFGKLVPANSSSRRVMSTEATTIGPVPTQTAAPTASDMDSAMLLEDYGVLFDEPGRAGHNPHHTETTDSSDSIVTPTASDIAPAMLLEDYGVLFDEPGRAGHNPHRIETTDSSDSAATPKASSLPQPTTLGSKSVGPLFDKVHEGSKNHPIATTVPRSEFKGDNNIEHDQSNSGDWKMYIYHEMPRFISMLKEQKSPEVLKTIALEIGSMIMSEE